MVYRLLCLCGSICLVRRSERPSAMPVYARDSWWREWRQTALPVAVTSGCWPRRGQHRLARDVAEVEDGVLWVERARRRRGGRSRRRHAGEPRRRPARRRAAGDRRPARSQDARRRRSRCSSASARRRSPPYTVLRLGRAKSSTSRWRRSRAAPGSFYFVLAAVGIFTLLVGGAVRLRRPARSGDAALLLALGRVLRRLHVLVQRPARSPRLGVLLGRRDLDPACCRRCSCTSRWSFPSAPRAGRGTRRCWRAGCRRSTCPAVVLGVARALAVLASRRRPDALRRRHRDARSPRVPLSGGVSSSAASRC